MIYEKILPIKTSFKNNPSQLDIVHGYPGQSEYDSASYFNPNLN
jgi:hypothetical protein